MKSSFYTISIEEALSPFIIQVETLISLRQLNSFRPLSQYSLCKACESVNLAVLKFISTAENIALNYQQISYEMSNSCNWSRSLVSKILECTMSPQYEVQPHYNSMGKIQCSYDQKCPSFNSLDNRSSRTQYSHASFIQFNEGLMKSIERILLIADWIMVLDMRRAIIKVIQSLNDMDSKGTDNFPAFMHMFSRFGTDMVELGELSGQRQLDLNNPQLRCLVAFVRSMLEKTTVMILAVWKVNFRHNSRVTRTLRALVFQHTNHLLDLLMGFLIVSHPLYNELSRDFQTDSSSQDVEFLEKQSQILYNKLFSNDTQYIWELLNKIKKLASVGDLDSNCDLDSEAKINQALSLVNDLLNAGQIFTQCSFVCLSERQHVISLCRRLRVQLRSCLEGSKQANGNSINSQARGFVDDLSDQIMTAIFNITVKYGEEILANVMLLPNHLNSSHQTSDIPCDTGKLIRSGTTTKQESGHSKNVDDELQFLGGTGEEQQQIGTVSKSKDVDFSVIKIKVLNICELLAHISMNKEISLVCGLTQEFIESLAHMINLSIQLRNEVPTSKHARESTTVLLEIWTNTINDIANIKEDISEWRKNKYSHQHYPFTKKVANSTDIMKNYKLLHSGHKVNDKNDRTSSFSLSQSPSPSASSMYNNVPRYNTPQVALNGNIHQTLSMNSLDKLKPQSSSPLNNTTADSPNPWLSVPEIDRIISMKGRNVIDIASQITMFSHNEGPLKTSLDLMNCIQQFVKEIVNFHAFMERNLIGNLILPELDKLPTLISTICSTQSQISNTRAEMFTKIDALVELVRHSVTLITTMMINWKGDLTPVSRQIKSSIVPMSNLHHGRTDMHTPPVTLVRNRFLIDDVSDNTSSFSDTTNTSILKNPRFALTRSSSMGRKVINSNFMK